MNIAMIQLGYECALRGPSRDRTKPKGMARPGPRARWCARDPHLPRYANSGCAGVNGDDCVKQSVFVASLPAPLRASAPSHFSAIIVKGRASAKALS